MKIYIDNFPLAFPTDNLQKPVFTFRKKDELGQSAISYSGNLTFIGSDFDYIYAKLVTSPTALDNVVVIKFVDDCCTPEQTYEFNIKSDSLKWCDNSCEMDAAAIEKSIEVEQLNCLNNTLIWDNYNNFQAKQHPRFSYCNELRPSWMHDVLMYLVLILCQLMLVLIPVIAVLAAIIYIINVIIGAINNLIPGTDNDLNTIDFDNDPSTNVFQEVQNFVNNMLSKAIGCGRKHPSPLIREYADNVCNKCGIQFQSSIFTNPSSAYYNACWHEAPIDKGTDQSDTTTYWLPRNQPLLSGTMFFDKLKTLFNAEWTVNNNILTFERHDHFTPQTPWLDLTVLDETEYTICWNWSNKKRYSYGQFYYQKDAINWVGGEANNRWGDIVEWNNPYSSLQKGDLTPIFEFTTCRFRDDGIDRDVLTFYKNAPFIGPIIQQYDGAILLNSHTCYLPMILIWDPTSGVANAKVSGSAVYFPGIPNNATHNPNVNATVSLNQFYNYPMWFKEGYTGNMYDNFWGIENPKLTNYQGFEYVATVELKCANLQNKDLYGMIKTSKGNAKIREITVNYETNQMIINGSI